jgi:Tol biopolymer transport system component
MSPEQARGEAVDHRSDLFSFGVVLYEMLTGSLPFRGKTGADTLSAILRDPTPRLSGVEHGEELQHVVNRCLAKDPEERYQTTRDLLADIRRIKRDTESGTRAAAAPMPRTRALWAVVAVLVAAGLVVVFGLRPEAKFTPRVGKTSQVTSEPGPELDAALSPDGKLVAYAAGPLFATKIFVNQVVGGRPVSLSRELPGAHRFPRWSPDGAQISFMFRQSENWGTHIVPALGGAPRRFPVPRAHELTWSPDGERIAYFIETETETGIFVGSIDGVDARRVIEAVAPCCLSWSPDGKRLAFALGNSLYLYNLNVGPSSLWVVDVESGESVRVTDDSHQNLSPVWTLDGKSLLFVSDRGGGRDIYRISVDSTGRPVGDPERLTAGLDVFTISSSADGRLLSYSAATSRQNIWSLPIPRKGPVSVQEARPVTSGNRRSEAVAVSPDGKWLAFDLNQNGDVSIFKMPVEGSPPVQVTEGPKDFYPTWSPDGREILFHAIRNDNRDIFVVSADGGAVRQLTSHAAHEFYPHWSPDGKRVVFHSTRGGANNEVWLNEEIYVMSKDRGELSGEVPEQLTFDQGGYAPRWSPDGRLIAYESKKWSGVWVTAPGGGEPRRLTTIGHRAMWSKDSQTLYFRGDPFDDRFAIWSVSLSGGEPERLVLFDDPIRQPVFQDWSTDGETFYFTLTEFEADVWVMELETPAH